MKKVNSVKDITSGMLVTLRNGNKMTVVTTTLYSEMDKCCTALSLFAPGTSEDGSDDYWPLSEYSDDFKCKHSMLPASIDDEIWDAPYISLPKYDIVQVWSCTCPCNAFANTTEYRVLLWSDPNYEAKTWDELTEEEKDAECSKHENCCDCPYNNNGCGDPEDEFEEEPDDEFEEESEEEPEDDLAALLDKVREECKDNPLATLIFKVLGDDLPDGHAEYVLGKTDKNPERKAPQYGDKSLAEKLYENDKKLADAGVSVVERDIALLAAMHAACNDHKD